jgi:hypothetical protein
MTDDRRENTHLPLPDWMRQCTYRRIEGYEDGNDAERLSQDPTFRSIGSAKIWQEQLVFTVALVRDAGVNLRGEPRRSEPDQSEPAGEGGSYGFTPASSAGDVGNCAVQMRVADRGRSG